MNAAKPVTAATVHAGQELPGFQRAITGMIMRTRQWHGTNIVHSDPAMAARQGMKKPPATGQISAAYIQEMCVAFLGEAMFFNSLLDVRFRRPVFEDERLAIGGTVAEVTPQPGGKKIAIHAWAKNQDGVEVTTARIEAFLPEKK
ncbi:MAG: hypothetical protein FJ039_11730 [Chloroflexi bacterium]|nr:hypothetical protein [Chloroflexota bacterium]